jgi:hypothetical protein
VTCDKHRAINNVNGELQMRGFMQAAKKQKSATHAKGVTVLFCPVLHEQLRAGELKKKAQLLRGKKTELIVFGGKKQSHLVWSTYAARGYGIL